MSQSVSAVVETIPATSAPPALQARHAALKTCQADINRYSAIQALPITGATRDRNRLCEAAAKTSAVIARLVLGYAEEHELGDLAAKVRLAPWQLQRGRLNTRVQLWQQIHDAAAEHREAIEPYGVTAEMLTTAKEQIDAVNERINSPRITIVDRRVATQNLAKAFKRLHAILTRGLDPIMETLRETEPGAYERYRAARLVIDRPGQPAEANAAPATAAAAAHTPATPPS